MAGERVRGGLRWTARVAAALALWAALATAAHGLEPPPRHVVQPGDTLAALAERYASTVPAIVAANRLADPDRIAVGQTLVIPPAYMPLVPIEARPGDTWETLARQHGLSADALRQLNAAAPGERLWVGQDLFVPASPEAASPALPPGPLLAIEAVPPAPRQGQTVLVRLHAREPLSLTVRWGERDVPLLPADPGPTAPADGVAAYWGLAAVPVLAPPGVQHLEVRWQSQTESGALRWPLAVADGGYPTFHIVLPPGKGDLLEPTLVRKEAEKVNAVWNGPITERAWTGRFRRPIADQFPTSAPFGQKRSYNGGPVNSFHAGQDFSAPGGTPVTAPARGTVVLAEPLIVRGNAVIVDHGLGVLTGYWHLSEIAVAVGQTVQPGDLIGLVGTTGLSTGNHLHWELRVRGVPVDPMQWLVQSFP
ncbi:MAG: peptidoglycan DD-metalloendopeptidase family protein [Caldilineales bacterium]|nr:peptidoglycan DD-metalloendopeptidase family protein [Caldilineales bacterium]MDW8316911.1 peptidoglycan DD-metalloendopeptidase family protein [Anaerolineae bacterium]